MAVSEKFQVEGVDEVLKLLSELERGISLKIERRAIKKALAIIKEEAERLAPVDRGGTIHKSKGTNNLQDETPLADQFKIRGKTRKKTYFHGILENLAPHAVLMEFGFTHTGPKPKLRRGEKVQARSFMRPAVDSKKGEATAEFVKVVNEELAKLARASAKKAAKND